MPLPCCWAVVKLRYTIKKRKQLLFYLRLYLQLGWDVAHHWFRLHRSSWRRHQFNIPSFLESQQIFYIMCHNEFLLQAVTEKKRLRTDILITHSCKSLTSKEDEGDGEKQEDRGQLKATCSHAWRCCGVIAHADCSFPLSWQHYHEIVSHNWKSGKTAVKLHVSGDGITTMFPTTRP